MKRHDQITEPATQPANVTSEFSPSVCSDEFVTFNGLAKIAASSMPRRTVLRMLLTGAVGLTLSKFGIRTAFAQATCLCNGANYEPSIQCCTSSGVQAKYPITNLAACPNKVPHPGHTPGFDGCGSSKTNPILYHLIPNSFGLANFEPCCNNHDICYDTCNDAKDSCDGNFLSCLDSACNVYLPFLLIPDGVEVYASCLAVAAIYYEAVHLGGDNAFNSAQMGACDCCSGSSCPESCAGSVCGSLPACSPGGDCVCFTSTEGSGACIHGDTPCSAVSSCNSTSDCPAGTTCIATSCCGSFGVCGPLCNPIVPALVHSNVASPALSGQKTLGGLIH